MAYPQPDKLLGGRVFTDHYTMSWQWECPCCGDNMRFPDHMHPRQDPKMEVCKILDHHLSRCQSMLNKFNNMSALQHQQMLMNKAYQSQMQQQQQMLMQQAYAQSPPQIYNNSQLGGVQNGNWGAAQTASNSANSLSVNTLQRAANAIRAADERAYKDTREPLERAGTTFGEIIGWRMWTIRRGYLYAYSRDELWVPKEPMVGKPDDYNDAGIWAFKERKRAILKMLNDRHHSDRMTVCGSVMLYGTVIEHKDGYRAEYGMIKSLDDICGAEADNDDPKEQLKLHRQFDKLKEKYLANSPA